MKRLMASSKFWIAVMDAFAATLAIVLTWFLAPDKVEQALALVAIWQPVIIAVIVGNWKEDVAKYEARGWLSSYGRPEPEPESEQETPK